MDNKQSLRIVTIRIRESEEEELVRAAMKDTGCITASKAVLQVIRGYFRLQEKNRELRRQLDKLTGERQEVAEQRNKVREANLEVKNHVHEAAQELKRHMEAFKKQMLDFDDKMQYFDDQVDLANGHLQSLKLEEEPTARKPPKGWKRN